MALKPAADIQAADWIVASLVTFAASVLSVVPAGFSSYVRVFHPARAYDRTGTETIVTPVSWETIAAANGTHAHAGMQLMALTGGFKREQPGVYDSEPEVGSLPRELAAPLVSALAHHTTTPDECWFAIWHGFGGTTPDPIRSAPTFSLPHREYHLLQGALAPMSVAGDFGDWSWHQSPNLWWPDDRAWCVATEIDFWSTYIGCSDACRHELLAVPELEAYSIDPATGINFHSDLVNPYE